MTPQFHPFPVNGPFDDPAVYVDFLYERRALLFDLGDIRRLPPRNVLRITHVFVSHTHIDHFNGFDQLLRLLLGRQKRLHLFGPPGFVDRVEHHLAAYTWNLVDSYPADFSVIAVEARPYGSKLTAEFHCRHAFRREKEEMAPLVDGILLDEEAFMIRTAFLDHRTLSLAFALEEKFHVNIMKNRLAEMGLPTGPWLAALKREIRRGEPDHKDFCVRWQTNEGSWERHISLGELKARVLQVVRGQKIVYVTDAAYTVENAEKIVALARGADYLFIETMFLDADRERARERHHLTARQAGLLARQAHAARTIPFHMSPRYRGAEEQLCRELALAAAD